MQMKPFPSETSGKTKTLPADSVPPRQSCLEIIISKSFTDPLWTEEFLWYCLDPSFHRTKWNCREKQCIGNGAQHTTFTVLKFVLHRAPLLQKRITYSQSELGAVREAKLTCEVAFFTPFSLFVTHLTAPPHVDLCFVRAPSGKGAPVVLWVCFRVLWDSSCSASYRSVADQIHSVQSSAPSGQLCPIFI